jgi:16S rRNA (cytosine1402-N4)-methyltransferase
MFKLKILKKDYHLIRWKLNMQMGLNNFSAEDVINKLDEKELDKIFKFFGEEKESKFIARNIVKKDLKKK